MDISSPLPAARPVQDLRPSADVAASARASAPAPALPPAAAGVPPASIVQGALVARGLLDPRAVSPTGSVDSSGEATLRTPDRPPPRLLKPWGVPMLPAEQRRFPNDGREMRRSYHLEPGAMSPVVPQVPAAVCEGAIVPKEPETPRGACTPPGPNGLQ